MSAWVDMAYFLQKKSVRYATYHNHQVPPDYLLPFYCIRLGSAQCVDISVQVGKKMEKTYDFYQGQTRTKTRAFPSVLNKICMQFGSNSGSR